MTGRYCSVNQADNNVWFLAGTFGNVTLVRRKCNIPESKAILFPLLVKEDSFAEDSDLKSEAELIKRAREATDMVLNMEASIDGDRVDHLDTYRVQSTVFDLTFPRENVYNVSPGTTRSVCDGFWLFIKPLGLGTHIIYFKGETSLIEINTTNQMKKTTVYEPIREHIAKNKTFRLEVTYELTIENQSKYSNSGFLERTINR